MSQCRVCKDDSEERGMIHYAVRHYAHPVCALNKWGAAFFDRLTLWQCAQFPYLAAVNAGFEKELKAKIELYKLQEALDRESERRRGEGAPRNR
jgi:hypothetical protein